MLYLKNFNFPNLSDEEDFRFNLHRTCYNSMYPFGILSKNKIENLEFKQITIFYGGNGSGKSTAINVISEKLGLDRDSSFNKTNFFNSYLELCSYVGKIPVNSRVITSDDVFDFMINLRNINEDLDKQRESLISEYTSLKKDNFKMKSLADYDKLKKSSMAKKLTQSEFVRRNMQENVVEQSNGESAFMYFTNKINSNALYLLDEPENSLSPEKQLELLKYLQDSVRFYDCQFIIATHSPFFLALPDALIYDFDENPVKIKNWTSLKNVQILYEFFKAHQNEFSEQV